VNRSSQPSILTVGHSNLEAAKFVELLEGQGVELLVDIRRFPGSKHVPWTKSENLEKLLKDAGIRYLHLESLGGRRRPVDGSLNGGWRVRQFQGYADHMGSKEFKDGLAKLEYEAQRQRPAMMCAEAQWWRCHRRLVADQLLIGGHEVLHLDGRGALQPHSLTEFAEVEDGRLSYPEPDER
jgi:uncharacterized protein (DUF488 family)